MIPICTAEVQKRSPFSGNVAIQSRSYLASQAHFQRRYSLKYPSLTERLQIKLLSVQETGRKGAAPEPPAYRVSKTVVFLMALHRLESLVKSLTVAPEETQGIPQRALWPLSTPCAVIERASCPDQRVIRSTLQNVCQAVEEEGSRPPGLLVVGHSCEVLHGLGQHQRWTVEDGFRSLDEIGSSISETNLLKELGDIIGKA